MTDKPSEIIYSFENFQLDPSRKLLLRLPDGDSVSLTNKAFNVLSLLVENSGKLVTKDVLMAKVWEDSFVEEANLTQTISVLRKILGENPNQHRFIVTEPGKGYRFVARVKESRDDADLGEDLSAGSIVEDTAAQGSNYRKAYLPASVGILAVLLVAGVYYFWDRSVAQGSQPSSANEVKSIAVLPFKNVVPDKENELLGIGMADAVITKLSHIRSIVVRQTKSVIRYADTTPEAIRVGREIDVDAVLEGNIQKADGRIRVSVRLFRVSDGTLLWAESFDQPDTDIFTLQDSISEKVARSLSLELDPAEQDNLKRRYTENIEAYHLYNKGRFFWNNRSGEDLRKSIAFYEQAIAKDENYALAYAGLAENYVLLQLFSRSHEKDFFPKAKQAAEKALSMDENIAEARTALAVYREQYEWDWEGADVEFKRAISANPSYSTAHQWYGEFLAFMGRTEESIAEVETAVELDPLSLSANTARAFPYLAARQYDRVIEKLQPALELDEDFPLALYYLGRSYDGKEMYKESIVQYQKAIAASGGSAFFSSAAIYAFVKSGQKAAAERTYSEISARAGNQPVSRYILARSLAALGEKEKALDELEKALQEHDPLMIIIKIDQNLDEIRNESRFQEILKKMRP